MSKKKIDISARVMEEIHEKNIKIRPKIYFVLGSIIIFISLIISIIGSIFLISLTRFALKSHGFMGQYRLEQLNSSFPWWAPVFAVFGLLLGILLLKKYDFSYRKNFLLIITGFVIAVFISGWLIDYTGLDDIWFKKGPMRRIFYQQELENRKGPNFQLQINKPLNRFNP